MNSVDPMTEPIQNVSLLMDDDCNCTAFDQATGEPCSQSESLKIIDEFQKLYESRIKNVDQEHQDEFDQVCIKLEISREWIRNLREQNIMLVQTVEDLERAACNKVKLLEQKLNHSSMLVSENLANCNYTEKTIQKLSNRVTDLENDEKYMRQKIEFLQSDIRGLLELIRRAAQENHWNLDGIKFFEIQHCDIPIPIDCTCDQEERSGKKMPLKLQVEAFQENEKKMVKYQKKLENQLADLNKQLETKEDTINKCVTQLQSFSSFKKCIKFSDQVACDSFATNNQQSSDIMLMADIVGHAFNEKDLEIKNLQRRLYDTESNLSRVTRDMNINVNNLKVKLNEKCKAVGEIEQMVEVKKELLAKQDALTTELAGKNETIMSLRKQMTILQEQCHYANIQINFKEDTIKELRKKMKKAMAKETDVMANIHQENILNQIILYLTKVKSLMEQESADLFKLRVDLEQLCCERNQKYNLDEGIDYISKLHSKKEESIETVNSIILKLENNNTLYTDTANLCFPELDNQHSKLMDIFRACTEAQTTTENIRDEMNFIASTFKSRHQKYVELNKEIANVQNQLVRGREKVAEAINRLQIREEEKLRHDERIKSGKIRLKDIKNELNHAQSRLSLRINDVQNNMNENTVSNYAEICICNDLLHSVIEEVEHISSTLQVFHIHGCCTENDLEELKDQFCNMDSSITLLQQKIEDALCEHNAIETTLRQREQKLERLERKVDEIHLTIQNISETIVFPKDQGSDIDAADPQLCIQTLSEILQIRQDLYGLRKEHEEMKCKVSQESCTECDEKTCLWKRRMTDLRDQVKILQHEAKCNQEANDFLRNNIKSLEKELHMTQVKADKCRQSHSMENIDFKKKIMELENNLKLQGEIECTLRQQLTNSEAELKKSKDLLDSVHIEHNVEESSLRCDCNQMRYDTMYVSQLFKTLENAMRSTKNGLQELKAEVQNLIRDDPSSVCSSARSIVNLVDKLQKYEDALDNCSREIEQLKSALYSKDKLLESRDEIIKIQKNSIAMTQTELKELHHKLQEKIDNQDQIISQYEREKKELLKQNELQIQTIGHLQTAVVEAKKCMDQMKQRSVSDVSEQSSIISPLTHSHGSVHDV